MARYRGPKTKIARRFGEPIFGSDKYYERRRYPPGQHGPNRRRGKRSESTLQLEEKQKAKYTYGILERQFENLFKTASSSKGITGEILLQLCESRLDNVVYRLGIAPSRRAARQLVTHRHITVNAAVMSIPSHRLKPSDEIAVRQRSKALPLVQEALDNRTDYDWLTWNPDTEVGEFHTVPTRAQIPENIKEQLIVELYSK